MSCDTVVADEPYIRTNQYGFPVLYIIPCTVSVAQSSGVSREGRVARLRWGGGGTHTKRQHSSALVPHSSTLVVMCVVPLLFMLFYVLFMCKCVLPPGDNPIAVNKYIISYQKRRQNK